MPPCSSSGGAGDDSRETVVLLNDTSAVCHWGCTATSTALKDGVVRRGYRVDAVAAGDIPRLGGALASPDDFDAKAALILFEAKAPGLRRRLEMGACVLVNAEGCLHGDRNVAKTLLYLAWYAAARLGKPVDLVNHSCYPQDTIRVDDDALLAIYRRAYAAVRFVAVREPVSWRLVKHGLRDDAQLGFDCLPLYLAARRPELSAARSIITFASSVIWQRRWAGVLVREMARLAKAGYPVRVLIGANGELNYEDKAFIRDLGRAWRRQALKRARPWQSPPWRLVNARTMAQWLATIAESCLLVSGRFHHSIAAACLGTPYLSQDSNTPKIEGLLEVLEATPGPRYGAPDWERALRTAIDDALAAPLPGAQAVAALNARLGRLAQVNFAALDGQGASDRIFADRV